MAVGVAVGGGAALGGFVYASAVPSSQVFGPALVRGPGDDHRVALTFDDGPASPFTEQILDILRARGIPATFFVCGKNVERSPHLLRRIHDEGHTLGNHTYSHLHLYFRRSANIAAEIDRAGDAIEKIVGYRPRIFRPPYGIRWFGLYPVLRERGMKLIQWSETGYDWKYGTDAIIQATLKRAGPGSVILLHDGHDTRPPERVDRSKTVAALPAILAGLMNAGLKFVSVMDFLPGV